MEVTVTNNIALKNPKDKYADLVIGTTCDGVPDKNRIVKVVPNNTEHDGPGICVTNGDEEVRV